VKINVAFQLCVCWRISENVGTPKFHTLMDPDSCKWVGNCLCDFCFLFFILAVPIFHAICSIWAFGSWNLPLCKPFAAFGAGTFHFTCYLQHLIVGTVLSACYSQLFGAGIFHLECYLQVVVGFWWLSVSCGLLVLLCLLQL